MTLSVRRLVSLLSASALVATLAVATVPAAMVLAATPSGTVIFDNTAAVLPPNLPSVGYEATSTSEWGTEVQFGGAQRLLTKVVVTMSDWALNSTYPTMPASGWTHPITLNLYQVGSPTPGALIKSVTQTFTIPWRPATPVCATDPTAYVASDGNCYHGLAFNITFDLAGTIVPDQLIVGIAYNTSDYGVTPLRATAPSGGPYDSLNVATYPGTGDGTVPTQPSVGSFPFPLGSYLNSTWTGAYGDGGAGGTGTFRFDPSSWGGYQPAVQFSALYVCSPTGLTRDGINLTAAILNPLTPVAGTVNATGCNIGVYYGPGTSGSVSGANIFGANYYGVVANAASVSVSNTSIHDIGETPLNGDQHGVGVLYTTIDQAGTHTGASATGTLSGTTITNYQKNGVVVSGTGAAVTVQGNTVTGQGPVNYIAQNGIEISYGGSATVTGNTVSGNWYTGPTYTACGLLFYKAAGVKQSKNVLFANQTNLCNAGRGGGNVSF
ncbi:MAG TPA: right-handed parallel beta-helix repeat-containing protein [Candidatus Saccharimonadales bacterium]|nr:right-handed parallel beta-helix repeat-containing protein [Candidatus Saccharimonadales bacterium]